MMFGYACRQTETLMPFPIETAHALAKRLELVRRTKLLPYLLPDGKTQVTVEFEDEKPVRVATVVVSAQHQSDVDIEQLRGDVITHVILPTLPISMVDRNTEFFINPTGRFVEGGPAADSGLTGRKIIADTYGGYARHGGGAFSGKDASKVDRSGAYMARYVAKCGSPSCRHYPKIQSDRSAVFQGRLLRPFRQQRCRTALGADGHRPGTPALSCAMNGYTNYLQAAGGVAVLVLLLVWIKQRNKK